jgi:phosphinothricin acetyltransferase
VSTPEILIRPAVVSDVPALLAIYNHYVETSPATFDVEPVSLEARLEWFHHYGKTGPYRLLVAEQDGRPVGYTSSSRFREKEAYQSSVETSVYVHEDAHGQGIGRRMYDALFAALAGERGVHRAYAGVTLPNPASVALHLSVGFRDIGVYDEVGHKFGRYWSVRWFEKRL